MVELARPSGRRHCPSSLGTPAELHQPLPLLLLQRRPPPIFSFAPGPDRALVPSRTMLMMRALISATHSLAQLPLTGSSSKSPAPRKMTSTRILVGILIRFGSDKLRQDRLVGDSRISLNFVYGWPLAWRIGGRQAWIGHGDVSMDLVQRDLHQWYIRLLCNIGYIIQKYWMHCREILYNNIEFL
jgi:hypothetical protein